MNRHEEIKRYLCGPRDHRVGAELYARYGSSTILARRFLTDDTPVVSEIMMEELRKLAGLSQQEYMRLPRLARRMATQGTLAEDHGLQKIGEATERPDRERDGKPVLKEAPEDVQRYITFRERYPFLDSPDCPDSLKILVHDMLTSHNTYRQSHAELCKLDDGDISGAAPLCEDIVENYIINKDIWEELNHYRDNGTLLGKVAAIRKEREEEEAEDLSKYTDIELMKMLRSANVQVSKHGKALEKNTDDPKAEIKYNRWLSRRDVLQTEVELRKKK